MSSNNIIILFKVPISNFKILQQKIFKEKLNTKIRGKIVFIKEFTKNRFKNSHF
jgi:hypothetical protein